MGLLDWMKRKGRTAEPEPENEPPEPLGLTRKGNPINLVHSQDWLPQMGLREARLHLGRSVEGFHGGFQDVPVGGDGAIQWSAAQTDVEGGWRAAYEMYDKWIKEDSHTFLDVENNAIREFAQKESKLAQAEPRTPDVAAEGNPSRRHSVFGDYPDRILRTQADVRKDDALLDISLVVHEIANDPDTNWRKYKDEFEKAVNGMREAFEPELRLQDAKTTVALRDPDSAQVHFWRSAWEPRGYVGAVDAEVGKKQDSLDRAFSAFNGRDDRVAFHGPSASVGDIFIHESTIGRGTQLSVYRIERGGYERLHAGEFSGQLKDWLEKSFGTAAKQLEPPVNPVWLSGKIEASGYDRDLGAHVTESVRGVLGESAEGFHYRLDRTDTQGEGVLDIQSFWSAPHPTRQAALASLKKDLVVEAREFSERYEAGKGGAFARVGDAMRNGCAVDPTDIKATALQNYSKRESKDASTENASRSAERSRSWDR